MSEFALFKQIARTIRYRKLEGMKGQSIEETDWDQFKATLLQRVSPNIALPVEWTFEKVPAGALVKYGILDLTASTSIDVFENDYRSGVRLLDEMRWVDRTQPPAKHADDSFLMFLQEEIVQQKSFCVCI